MFFVEVVVVSALLHLRVTLIPTSNQFGLESPPIWVDLGVIWSFLRAMWGQLGANLGRAWAYMGFTWVIFGLLGANFGQVGANSGYLRLIQGQFGGRLRQS